MNMRMRILTDDELLLVAGGLSSNTIVITGPGGGLNPGDYYNPGPGNYDAPSDTGDTGGGSGGDSGAPGADGDGEHYTSTDLNGDGKFDEHFYHGENGKLYYSVRDGNGQQILYPATLVNLTPGTSASLASNLGVSGVLPTAGITYTETTSNGSYNFTIDPNAGRFVK